MKAPNVLRIGVDGHLWAADADVPVYLAKWVADLQLEPGTPVCVIAREDLQKLYDEIALLRELLPCVGA